MKIIKVSRKKFKERFDFFFVQSKPKKFKFNSNDLKVKSEFRQHGI